MGKTLKMIALSNLAASELGDSNLRVTNIRFGALSEFCAKKLYRVFFNEIITDVVFSMYENYRYTTDR